MCIANKTHPSEYMSFAGLNVESIAYSGATGYISLNGMKKPYIGNLASTALEEVVSSRTPGRCTLSPIRLVWTMVLSDSAPTISSRPTMSTILKLTDYSPWH